MALAPRDIMNENTKLVISKLEYFKDMNAILRFSFFGCLLALYVTSVDGLLPTPVITANKFASEVLVTNFNFFEFIIWVTLSLIFYPRKIGVSSAFDLSNQSVSQSREETPPKHVVHSSGASTTPSNTSAEALKLGEAFNGPPVVTSTTSPSSSTSRAGLPNRSSSLTSLFSRGRAITGGDHGNDSDHNLRRSISQPSLVHDRLHRSRSIGSLGRHGLQVNPCSGHASQRPLISHGHYQSVSPVDYMVKTQYISAGTKQLHDPLYSCSSQPFVGQVPKSTASLKTTQPRKQKQLFQELRHDQVYPLDHFPISASRSSAALVAEQQQVRQQPQQQEYQPSPSLDTLDSAVIRIAYGGSIVGGDYYDSADRRSSLHSEHHL
ncbi:hypothetical protein BGZ83_008215 [Gryganskiella cystojenkinii]|nr:hypothetical protein BGZ83_008215 [Gryganskiella cystojenkinii]